MAAGRHAFACQRRGEGASRPAFSVQRQKARPTVALGGHYDNRGIAHAGFTPEIWIGAAMVIAIENAINGGINLGMVVWGVATLLVGPYLC